MSTTATPIARKDMSTKIHKASTRQKVNTDNFTSTYETTKNPGKHAPWEKDQTKIVQKVDKKESTPWEKDAKIQTPMKTLKQQDNNAPWSKDQVVKPKEIKKQDDCPWNKGFVASTPKKAVVETTPWHKDQVKQISEEKRTKKENIPWEKESAKTARTIKEQNYSAPWDKHQVKVTQERFVKESCPWDKQADQKKKDIKSTKSDIFTENTSTIEKVKSPRKRISSAINNTSPWDKNQMDYFKGSKQVVNKTTTDPLNAIQSARVVKTETYSPITPFASEHNKQHSKPAQTVRQSNTFASTASNFW